VKNIKTNSNLSYSCPSLPAGTNWTNYHSQFNVPTANSLQVLNSRPKTT